MTEQEEETNKSKEEEERVLNMEFDIDDMENSWPLINHHHQQISTSPFVNSNLPMSPLLLSSSEQLPFSPLWAFSDADNYVDRFPSSSTPSYPIFLSCNTNSVTESRIVNDEINKIPSPLVGLMPVENTDGHCVIKERMTQALRYFIESTKQHVLAQVWVPVKKGGRSVLTTLGQPFVLDPHCNGLNQYRMVSVMYMFSTEGESDGELGLPGRVYRQKLPEWTPDVQYYSSKEYSRLDHALNYNVRGTLALPVFEPSMESCVGVLELIMTSQKINYAPEVDKVCKALEAVNLKSSEILDYPMAQICNEGRQNALAEILEILTVVCETHKLPLAQTWIPCMHGSVLANGGGLKKSCTSFDGRCHGQVCMSVTDVAFYVVDAHMWGFREACHEHHLKRGQGVAGRAFLSHHSCFCQDITQFCKTEYPLVHYARMFGLTSSFAICLRSSYTGDDDYILEFFLRPSITDHHEQKRLLGFIMATMKQHFQSLKVASGMDLEEEEGFVEIIEASTNERVDLRLECFPIPQSLRPFEDDNKLQNEGQRVELEAQNHQPNTVLDASESVRDILPANKNQISAPLPEKNGTKKPTERKRGKTEKTISLEVLQQYFSGSLKDAAKSLGVCPTTMKRICRQHGISRWPSRKINKVNRSLSKLKRVMESVQGADRAFGINHHITSAPIPVAVGSISWPSNVNGRNQQDPQNSRSPEFHSDRNGSPNCKSPGSNGPVGNEDQTVSGRILIQEEWAMQNGISPELGNHTNKYRTTSGSREESGGTPVSHGSCHGSPANDSTPAKKTPVSPFNEPYNKSGGSPEILIPPIGQLGSTTSYSIPSPLVAVEAQATFGRMLIDDAGSSKDLRSLCPLPADGIVDERVPECCWPIPPCSDIAPTQTIPSFTNVMPDVRPRQETRSITIKAAYKEDIIRFRVALNSGIVELKDEVAKRLKLEVGTFDIKYLDDDQEWVLIACDADLNECIDIARSSGSNAIRLSVHDVNTHLGSSCESTGEL